jgi:hypothetical protein
MTCQKAQTSQCVTGQLSNSAYLTSKEAAIFLRSSASTLSKFRVYGGGPPYLKLGRKILYERAALVEWLDAHRRQSTSETTK